MGFNFAQQPGKTVTDKRRNKKGVVLISVITPFYNGSDYFEQTFRCVCNQTFPWFEWIIVDDGSEDKERFFLQELAKKDSRFFVYSKENGGPASARNYAVDKARGEIIVSLDADDLIEPTYLETTYWALYFHPDAGWAYTDSIGFGAQEYEWKVPFSDEELKKENFLIEIGTIRKKALLEAGKYDDREKFSHEDWRLWIQLMAEKYYPVHLGYFGAWYRRVEDGAYAYTLTDEERRSHARKKIAEVAKKITWKVEAAEYPGREDFNRYRKPKLSGFDQLTYEEHDKTRIMMLLPWMKMGGADAFNLEIVKRLDKNQYDISILTTVKGESEWRQRFELYTDEIFELPSFLDMEDYAEFISYFIKSRQIDMVFLSNSYYGYSIVPWLRVNFPDLIIADYVHMEEWYWRNGGYARISGQLQGFLDKTYVCNECTRKVMTDIFHRKPEEVETIHIGVDHQKYSADILEYGMAKDMLCIEKSRPCILFPCRIHQQKRPYLMLEIAQKIKAMDENVAFIVAGDGELLEEIRKSVKERGLEKTVYFAGKQADMRTFYKDSDITLICSIKEGLALTAYESCSMGVPVISSDAGGQGDLIDNQVGVLLPVMQKETEINDYAYSEEEISQYAERIMNLLNNKEQYAALSRNCRKRIEEGFSLDSMIQKLENEIQLLCKNQQYVCRRRERGEELRQYYGFTEEFLTVNNECELRDQEIAQAWESCDWLKSQRESLEKALEDKQAELDVILNTRSWQLCQRYMHFMESSMMGRFLMKLRKLVKSGGRARE